MRELFELPDDVSYLNCAYMSPLARPVVDAAERGLRRKSRPWEITPAHFFDESETCRARFAALINAGADDIAIVPSVSYGITQASRNLRLGRGRRIVVLAEQFPSNVYAWQALAARDGGQVDTVDRPADGAWTTAVIERLETGLVDIAALPHCHWTDGALLDIEAISACCQRHDIALVLDVSQSLGALPLDVERIRPAFLVCATYKWLLGPYSLAFVYAREDMQAGEPLDLSWITRERADQFAGLVNYEDRFQAGARRYDVGERANFALLPAAIAALDSLLAWTPSRIQSTLSAYTGEIESAARTMGLRVASPPDRAGHFLGIRFPDGLPTDALETFANRQIYVSVRGDSVRVTPHLYNDPTDRERFLETLARIAGR